MIKYKLFGPLDPFGEEPLRIVPLRMTTTELELKICCVKALRCRELIATQAELD